MNSMTIANYTAVPFAHSSYAFLLWDSSVQSYINCYLLLRPPHTILIDTGKTEHLALLIATLSSLGVAPEDVTHIIATHGHQDHVGGAAGFPFAHRHIHAQDTPLLTETSLAEFIPNLPDNSAIIGLQCHLLGQHTPGSIALFDPQSRAVFCGDHICFFGDALPEDGPVSYGGRLREITYKYIHKWMHGPERLDDNDLALFLRGLATLAAFEAEILCTGHGAILEGDITPFFARLQEAASR
jgi:glyoxylase-like metal-dependent hydrolase (beta-lactamase superfamily II)